MLLIDYFQKYLSQTLQKMVFKLKRLKNTFLAKSILDTPNAIWKGNSKEKGPKENSKY